MRCPNCGSANISSIVYTHTKEFLWRYICNDCGTKNSNWNWINKYST